MAQSLIYMWVTVLLLRVNVYLSLIQSRILGVSLVGVSLLVVGYAVKAAYDEMPTRPPSSTEGKRDVTELTEHSKSSDSTATRPPEDAAVTPATQAQEAGYDQNTTNGEERKDSEKAHSNEESEEILNATEELTGGCCFAYEV
jgi:hypothetical protein